MHKYNIKYKIDISKEGYTTDDINQDTEGLTDSLVLTSIMTGKDGRSFLFGTFDGETGEPLSFSCMFMMWCALTNHLNGYPLPSDNSPSKIILNEAATSAQEFIKTSKIIK